MCPIPEMMEQCPPPPNMSKALAEQEEAARSTQPTPPKARGGQFHPASHDSSPPPPPSPQHTYGHPATQGRQNETSTRPKGSNTPDRTQHWTGPTRGMILKSTFHSYRNMSTLNCIVIFVVLIVHIRHIINKI